ncbi:uncharacterized protein LTR77_009620 [Saxophila tyrrhenica]|uniref:Uncharacterized protein n=1 Tax=Saxophila tyrrhenica TaxID=1690608 RepID=A0AAV9P215_9PEZI|nr:hypothetical protein LTR77_009620 [Saxophila tyrrhenica]
MGLISKIEDKLSGSKSSDNQQYESKESSSSGNASTHQHPVSGSTSGPTGTAVPSNSSGSTSAAGRDGYGMQPTDTRRNDYSGQSSNRDPRTADYPTHSSRTADYPSQSTSHSTHPGGYSTTTRSEAPAGYSNDPRTTTTTNTTSSSSPRQPYDPYSSRGQRAAAAAAHEHGMSPTTGGSRAPYADAETSRSQQAGIASGSRGYGPEYINSAPHASSGGQQDLSSISGGDSRHHYGRDAAMAGGVGAGGVGAYEYGKHQQQPGSSSTQNYSRPGEYAGRASAEQTMPMSAGAGSGGIDHAKKMGGAYEAGYRDGMEHMRQEMENSRRI